MPATRASAGHLRLMDHEGGKRVFHYESGLKLTEIDLAIDFRRRQPRGFISHAHSDHMARHELAIGTPATLALYQHRLGRRATKPIAFGEPLEWDSIRLTTFPAGHCLGSSMLLAEGPEGSLLYTGDFKLSESATAEKAELPTADILVMESTYGDPQRRHPPRDESVAQLLNLVSDALGRGSTPVIRSYALGKSQEVTRLLTDAGFEVRLHPAAFEIAEIYERFGVSLGCYDLLQRGDTGGAAIVLPPPHSPTGWLEPNRRITTIAVTGWANSGLPRRQAIADHAVALSDHADYAELIEAIDRVGPSEIYCTHGPPQFVDELRSQGYNAFCLEDRHRTLDPLHRKSR